MVRREYLPELYKRHFVITGSSSGRWGTTGIHDRVLLAEGGGPRGPKVCEGIGVPMRGAELPPVAPDSATMP